jgi:hypothetical protein
MSEVPDEVAQLQDEVVDYVRANYAQALEDLGYRFNIAVIMIDLPPEAIRLMTS